MKLYVYDTETQEIIQTFEEAGYTDSQIKTGDGTVLTGLSEKLEFSSQEDFGESLRADWRRKHPGTDSRLVELEALVAELLFGGETA